MAGHVTKRHLKLPEVDKLLLEGCVLWKWEDVSHLCSSGCVPKSMYIYFLIMTER